jgi:Leucine-rich repeat (LRR) protein
MYWDQERIPFLQQFHFSIRFSLSIRYIPFLYYCDTSVTRKKMQLTKDLLASNLSNKDIDGIDSLKGSSCTKLDLSGNKLKSVSELSSLALTWLNLCKNQIKHFPFENFPLLSMLNLGQNEIEELKHVSRCKKLKALILNNNHLQKAVFTDNLPLESLGKCYFLMFSLVAQ